MIVSTKQLQELNKMPHIITEEHVEENVLDILKNLNYDIIRGSDEEYLPGGSSALRPDYKHYFHQSLTGGVSP